MNSKNKRDRRGGYHIQRRAGVLSHGLSVTYPMVLGGASGLPLAQKRPDETPRPRVIVSYGQASWPDDQIIERLHNFERFKVTMRHATCEKLGD